MSATNIFQREDVVDHRLEGVRQTHGLELRGASLMVPM